MGHARQPCGVTRDASPPLAPPAQGRLWGRRSDMGAWLARTTATPAARGACRDACLQRRHGATRETRGNCVRRHRRRGQQGLQGTEAGGVPAYTHAVRKGRITARYLRGGRISMSQDGLQQQVVPGCPRCTEGGSLCCILTGVLTGVPLYDCTDMASFSLRVGLVGSEVGKAASSASVDRGARVCPPRLAVQLSRQILG